MSSKKQKKQKGKTISLQEFTASLEPTTAAGQNIIYAPKAPVKKSWADEVDEDEYESITNKEKIILPSAPRAARGPDYDEASIPHQGPFVAHVGNISFDIDEGDLYTFFQDQDVVELRLPRDMNNRLRGFGYVTFKTREQLIEALCMNEKQLNGRPIRINLGQGESGERRGGGRNVDQTPDDWRSAPSTELDAPRPDQNFRGGRSDNYGGSDFGSRGGGAGEYGRRPYGGGRNDEGDSDFGNVRDGPRPDFGDRDGGGGRRGGDFGDRDGGRNYGGGRDNFDRSDFGSRRGGGYGGRRDENSGGEEEGTWRNAPVPRAEPSQEDRRYQNQDQDRDRRFRTQDREGDNRDGRYGSRDRELSPDFSDARSRQPRNHSPEFTRPKYVPPPPVASRREEDGEEREPRKPSPPRERKKLVIAPRTVKESASEPVGSSSIFGGARPVDTAAREREIEKKLEAEQNEEPRMRILQRPRPEEVINENPRRVVTVSPQLSNERLQSPPPRPLAKEATETKSNVKPSDTSTHKSESIPPPAPPAKNAWAERPKWNNQEVHHSNNTPTTTVVGQHYDEDEGHDDRSVSRDDQHSPHPDSDHKDTNSEPEDERDLVRLEQEADDDFQTVERRGARKSKTTVNVEQQQNYRPPASRGEVNRGGVGGRGGGHPRGSGGGGPRRGHY